MLSAHSLAFLDRPLFRVVILNGEGQSTRCSSLNLRNIIRSGDLSFQRTWPKNDTLPYFHIALFRSCSVLVLHVFVDHLFIGKILVDRISKREVVEVRESSKCHSQK